MKKILMLDLFGTIISYSDYKIVRPYAIEFLDFSKKFFDEIYINSSANESDARYIMKSNFGIEDIKIWKWNFLKTENYDKLIKNDNIIFHVEDGVSFSEKNAIALLKVKYFEVNRFINRRINGNDTELLDLISKIIKS
jgi:hypothetical protein